ncbi:hypothetical protein BDZ91DRAFT_738010, partial [Kalaharituber pfeilii]
AVHRRWCRPSLQLLLRQDFGPCDPRNPSIHSSTLQEGYLPAMKAGWYTSKYCHSKFVYCLH